jgi:hypothetical protein
VSDNLKSQLRYDKAIKNADVNGLENIKEIGDLGKGFILLIIKIEG